MILKTDWRPHGAAPAETHIFAIGDVHGQAGALERLLDHLGTVPTAPGAGREMIFLGDLVDRGPESLRTIALARAAVGAADTGTILPGNHELMMLRAMDRPDEDIVDVWLENGGMDFLIEVAGGCAGGQTKACLLEHLRRHLPEGFEDHLRTAPGLVQRGGFTFVHAGIDPMRSIEQMLEDPREDLFETEAAPSRHWAWIRAPFLAWAGNWPHPGVDLVVHGHTPATKRPIDDPDVAEALCVFPDKRARICLDVGATARPQVAALEIRGEEMRLHLEVPKPFLPF